MALFNKEMSIELARLVDEHKNDLFLKKAVLSLTKFPLLNAFGQSFQKVPGGVASDLFGESEPSSKRPRELGEESSSASLETPKFREKVSRPPSRASNLEDLQRSVLEIELENAKKISQILLRIPSISDKLSVENCLAYTSSTSDHATLSTYTAPPSVSQIGPTYEGVEESSIVESEKFFRNL